jgi:hypothetical protein
VIHSNGVQFNEGLHRSTLDSENFVLYLFIYKLLVNYDLKLYNIVILFMCACVLHLHKKVLMFSNHV